MTGLIIFISGLFIWNGIISFFLFRSISHYNKLTVGVTSRSLRESLEKILDAYLKNKKDIGILKQSLFDLEADSHTHLQRVGIVRFNPFSDTGGSQSFTIALLDKDNNGVVMTSLYARTGNRWYIKNIHNGKATDVELSREEKAAIQEATDGKKK
jgi:hypothetical protein